jgi:hypothetical protein
MMINNHSKSCSKQHIQVMDRDGNALHGFFMALQGSITCPEKQESKSVISIVNNKTEITI